MKARGVLLPLLVLLLSAAAACAPQTAGQGTLEVVDHFIDYSGLASWDENCTVAGGVLRLRSPVYEPYNTSGLVLWLHFDEESGSIAYDSSGHGNNGTIYGATSVDGKFGRAIYCDGVDDYVEAPHFYYNSHFTVSVWFKFNYQENPTYRYHTLVDDGYGVNTDWAFSLDRGASLNPNKALISFGARGGGSIINYYYWLYAGTWYHAVVVTNDGIYINGVKIASGNINIDGITKGSHPLRIARSTYSSSSYYYYFPGIIDEVRIYSRALTADEIAFEYNNGKLYRTRTVAASRDMLSGVGPVYPVALRVAATVPYGAEALIQCSLDGGASWSSWHSLTTGVSRIAFTPTIAQGFMYRLQLQSNGDVTPEVDYVALEYMAPSKSSYLDVALFAPVAVSWGRDRFVYADFTLPQPSQVLSSAEPLAIYVGGQRLFISPSGTLDGFLVYDLPAGAVRIYYGEHNQAYEPPTGLWQYLFAGDVPGFTVAVWTLLMRQVFWVIPYFAVFILVYIKTESLEYCAILFTLLSGFFLLSMPAEVGAVAWIFLAVALGYLLYKMITRLIHLY
ncbi:MAG: LamG domain-containing protein [Thermofilaceae archaeon]